MRLSSTVLGVVAALALAPVIAHGGPANEPQKGGKPTTVGKPTTSGKPTTTATMSAKAPVQGGPKSAPKSAHKPTTSKPVTTTTTRTTGKPTTAGKTAKAPSTTTTTTTAAKGGKHSGTTSTTTATTTPTTSNTTPLNPIAAKIDSKPNLKSKLTALLPIDPLTGKTMTLDKASLGFKNQGQFIAALHVSENLGIPFTELKSNMVTITPGAPGEQPTATQTGSLGQAIQKSKATANVTTEVQRAEQQASADLQVATSPIKTTPKGGAR